jgi:hypothetical protein
MFPATQKIKNPHDQREDACVDGQAHITVRGPEVLGKMWEKVNLSRYGESECLLMSS